MAKTLYIVRHAKAKPKEAGGKDFDRTLTSQGLQQSSRLGVYIYKKNTDISAIVSSDAMRAMQTAEQIADQINYDISKIHFDPELYEASVRIILNIVCDLNNDWNEVIIVGHNPVMSFFVEYVTGHHFDGMEAGSLVKISFDEDDWKQFSEGSATFEYYVSPEDFNIEG